MLDKLKDDLICEMKEISKDGVKIGNIEYISKLAETYKNLNKADKEELEAMIFDERMDGNWERDKRRTNDYYMDRDDRYGARGRGSYARRDSRGRYADHSDMLMPLENRYFDYMDMKKRYRDSGGSKSDMHEGLEMFMKYMVNLVEDLYRDCDSEEERRVMEKYLKRMSEIR